MLIHLLGLGTRQSKSVFVVFVLVLCRLTTARVTLLANRGPRMISSSASVSFMPAALRLKRAAHFVAIDGTRKSQRRGAAASRHLHVKRYVISIHAAGQRRGAPRALQGAAQLGPILLDLHGGLLGAIPALP